MRMLFKSFTLFSLKKKTKHFKVNVTLFLLKAWFPGARIFWFRWKKKEKKCLCRRFPNSWEDLTAETWPTWLHTTGPWGNKPNSCPEGSWANCFIMKLSLQQSRSNRQHGLYLLSSWISHRLSNSLILLPVLPFLHFSPQKTNCSSLLLRKHVVSCTTQSPMAPDNLTTFIC